MFTNPRNRGAFTRKATARGKSVRAFAAEVLGKLKGKVETPRQAKLLRQAVFAHNAGMHFGRK
jgi:hypothetical protein